MSAARTAHRLAHAYPRWWRARYGKELEALIVDMSGGRWVSWRTRTDVIVAGGRERLRTSGQSPERSDQVRGGASLVLWAWALFVFARRRGPEELRALAAGAAGRTPPLATVAFDVVIEAAIAVGALVIAGIAVALPGTARLVGGGGWAAVRSVGDQGGPGDGGRDRGVAQPGSVGARPERPSAQRW